MQPAGGCGRIAALNVTVTIHDFPSLAAFAALGRDVEAFVKVDCGLGRSGFNPDDFAAAFARIAAAPLIRMTGIYAHLAVPEDPSGGGAADAGFAAACGAAEAAGFQRFERMVASSRVIIGYPG